MNAAGQARRGFTLIELLVVAALIAGLATFLMGGFRQNQTASLQSAQSTLLNLVTAARTAAMTSGRTVRILVHIDPTSPRAPARYLRALVLQSDRGNDWETRLEVYLPSSIYVVPRDPGAIAGLIPAGVAWTRPSDGQPLRSSALRANKEVSAAIAGSPAERWCAIEFSARGTTMESHALVLAAGRAATGQVSPVTLDSADTVRGLMLSRYGVPALVNGRTGF